MSQYDLPPALAMALSQLYTNEVVSQEMLDAFASTPRERFVPPHLAHCAYVDEELDIGENRYVLAPLDTARLLQMAELKPVDTVLDIACGMGYTAAVAALLAKEVFAIDTSALFIQRARDNFLNLNRPNAYAHVVEKLTDGLPAQGPYDVIIINGGVQQIPTTLFQQLNNNGRLVCVARLSDSKISASGLSRLTVYRKIEDRIVAKEGVETAVPPLTAFNAPKQFKFG